MLIYDGLHYDALAVCHSPFLHIFLYTCTYFSYILTLNIFLIGRNKDVIVGPIFRHSLDVRRNGTGPTKCIIVHSGYHH